MYEIFHLHKKINAFLLCSVDNVNKLWFEASASYKESVDVGTGREFLGSGTSDWPTVLDSHSAGDIGWGIAGQPVTQRSVNILGLKKKIKF